MQVGAVRTATEDAATVEDEPVAIRPGHNTATVSEREIKPAIMAQRHAVRAVQAVGGLLRRPAQSIEKLATLIRHTVAVRVYAINDSIAVQIRPIWAINADKGSNWVIVLQVWPAAAAPSFLILCP